jgi:hypothetical protein
MTSGRSSTSTSSPATTPSLWPAPGSLLILVLLVPGSVARARVAGGVHVTAARGLKDVVPRWQHSEHAGIPRMWDIASDSRRDPRTVDVSDLACALPGASRLTPSRAVSHIAGGSRRGKPAIFCSGSESRFLRRRLLDTRPQPREPYGAPYGQYARLGPRMPQPVGIHTRRSARFGIICCTSHCNGLRRLRPRDQARPRLGRHGSSSAGLASVLVSIHPRLASFTNVHADRVCAVRGRGRTPVNTGQHCWKACWGQPLASSNFASSATSDQAIHNPMPCVRLGLARLRSLMCSLIHSTHIGIKRPKGRRALLSATAVVAAHWTFQL